MKRENKRFYCHSFWRTAVADIRELLLPALEEAHVTVRAAVLGTYVLVVDRTPTLGARPHP